MTRLTRDPEERFGRSVADDWGQRPAPPPRSGSFFPGWLVTGLVVAGLGALTWYYIAPDVRRYMKIRNM
jgi:hypothetical protein